ncbi:MAG: SDR family NAD(P)-dependent oxidoreductase [Anaerolineales bacterium]|nr:SDR family NAD(P)-dependent oxidoreductase [Anaerolineales bacterium]
MKYLITGGAGFIGSHIARALLQQGADVRIFDNFSSGKRENLSGLDVEVIEGDLRDASRVTEAVRGVNVIFHEAAFVSVAESMEKPQECFDVNVTGTSILFESARRAGVNRIVIASSAAVYGDTTAMPLVEDTPLKQLSPYATSKRVDEMYAELFTHQFGLEVAVLRYFNVYGPRQRPDSMYAAAVPIFIRRMLDNKPITVYGDGGQSRDLVNVRDVVQANLLASTHPAAPDKSSTSAPASRLVCLTCSIFSTKFSPTPPNMSTLNHAPATSTAPSAHPKKPWIFSASNLRSHWPMV